MNILFVAPYVPSTVRIRPYAFIRELARLGHRVTLVCLVQPAREAAYLDEIRPYCRAVHPISPGRYEPYWRTLKSLPAREPLSVAFCRSAALERTVAGLSEQGDFDILHTEFIRATPATARLNGRPKVYDAVDSLALAYRRSLSAPHVSPARRMLSFLEWVKLRRYEPSVLRRYDRVLVSSPADGTALESPESAIENRGLVLSEGEGLKIRVLPNGVDLEYFSFYDGPRPPATLVFLGKMSYYVNIASMMWFYREVFPLIRRRRPDLRLKILGREPASGILALAADPAVEVTGTVPDVRPHLAQATLSVCPMVSGAGIQNKMLEAMATGLPTVATGIACQALRTRPGRDVLAADGAQDFAEAVLHLLEDPALRRQMAINGRRYVEAHHHWGDIGMQLESVYAGLLDSRKTL